MDAQQMPGQEIPAPIRMTAFWCHLSALSIFVGVPFGNILGPLIIWQTQKERHPFIDDQGKEAMNFQLSMLIYSAVACLAFLCLIGVFLLAAVAIVQLIYTIIAASAANNGIAFRYPSSFTIRFFN